MTGRVLGFGARILKSNDRAPKYINTPENEIYLKHKVLYGMFQSRQAIGKLDECFLVEGYTDVISLHQGGVENVVASSGTSLTEDQLKLIGQLTKNLTILYDGDPAGIKAALRGLDMALSRSFNVQLVLLPDKEDPDSYIQKHGAQLFHEYVKAHKQDVISFRLQVGLEEAGSDPVKKSKLVNEIAESISRINKAEDFALQAHFIRVAATKLGLDEDGLVRLVNKNIRERIETDQRQEERQRAQPQPESEAQSETTVEGSSPLPEQTFIGPSAEIKQEWQLLKILIEYGHMAYKDAISVAEFVRAEVDEQLFEDPMVLNLYREYFIHVDRFGSTPETFYFSNHADENVRRIMATLLQPEQVISEQWKAKFNIESLTGAMVFATDVESSLSYFQVKKIIKMKEMLMEKLRVTNDPVAQQVYGEQIVSLIKMQREQMQHHSTVILKSNKYKI
jgi:DNA primase